MIDYGFSYPSANINTNNSTNYNNWNILNNENFQTSVNGAFYTGNNVHTDYNYNTEQNSVYNSTHYYNTNTNYDFNTTNYSNDYKQNYNYEQNNNNNQYNNNYEQYNNNYGQTYSYDQNYNSKQKYQNYGTSNIYEQNYNYEQYNNYEQANNYEQNNTFSNNIYNGQYNFGYKNKGNNENFAQNDNQSNNNYYNNYNIYPPNSNNNIIIYDSTENLNNNNYNYNNNNNYNYNYNTIYNNKNSYGFNNINTNYNNINIYDNSNQNNNEEYELDLYGNLIKKNAQKQNEINHNNNIYNDNTNNFNNFINVDMSSRNTIGPISTTREKLDQINPNIPLDTDYISEPIIHKTNTFSIPVPAPIQKKEVKEKKDPLQAQIGPKSNQPPIQSNALQSRVIDLQPKTTSPLQIEPQNKKINFHFNGLINIGSTCYMNATLQCLLHVSELVDYFLKEFPNDFSSLCQKNSQVPSKGNISRAFYKLIRGVYPQYDENNPFNSRTFGSGSNNPVSPDNFQKVLGDNNSQFKNFEANDSKDLILYLLQTMHEELNYFGDVNINLGQPNQYDRVNTFQFFFSAYERKNFSIISKIFYGTFENMTRCRGCQKILFNYQKFEFISFSTVDYKGKIFNIYNGFEDNQKISLLTGDNQFYCNICKKLCDADLCTKIIVPPNKLLINIDYGKNKKFSPSSVIFGEEIDITKYINFNFGVPIKYRLIGICTHFGYSGSYGHYVAYCKHPNGKWFIFNDSTVNECSKNNIYGGSPYLLLYEKIIYLHLKDILLSN